MLKRKMSQVSHGPYQSSTPDEASDKRSILSGNPSGTPSGPLKKDGTITCGYQSGPQNRVNTASAYSGGNSSGYQSGPLKKDGTPDMRYAADRR